MRFELKDIKDGRLNRELTCDAGEFPVLQEMEEHDEIHFTRPISFKLRLQQSGQLIEADGRFETRVTQLCGRCLQTYENDLCGDFAFTFTPYPVAGQVDVDEDVEIELDTDELGLVYYKDDSLDLLPPLQDQVVIALPISPLCSDDCAGLCGECGCNLNLERCNCEKKVFNNKFSALAGLKIGTTED